MIHAIALLTALRGSEPAASSDAELIARHHAGDDTAFAAIYRAHVDAVYRRLTRILGPIPEREDLTQDVFLALHRGLPRFRGEAKLGTLIHRIAINRACEHLRRVHRRPATPLEGWLFDELVSACSGPEAQATAREELVRVFAALAKIKPKKRIAFLLRVVDGLGFDEIAQLVDATPETVAKRVQHAQHELDALLARCDRRAS
ncbi:MAG TPA: RNA polymerase sigma factor [Kofleriaceae bacterium]|nr:RNA polymerase sigma factor [Kofleriaceae bacterium]